MRIFIFFQESLFYVQNFVFFQLRDAHVKKFIWAKIFHEVPSKVDHFFLEIIKVNEILLIIYMLPEILFTCIAEKLAKIAARVDIFRRSMRKFRRQNVTSKQQVFSK